MSAAGAQAIDWPAIAPPVIAALTALVVLLAGGAGRLTALRRPITLTGLGLALIALLPLVSGTRRTFCTPDGCSYVVEPITVAFQLVIVAAAALVVLLSAGREEEYHFLLLSSVTGALTLAAARDLITIVVALEVVTLPAIALVALRDNGSRRREASSTADGGGAEAGLKFFLISVVSIAVMLFGISLVYGVTGSVQLAAVSQALSGAPAGPAAVAVLLTLVGLAFKVGAVPFHFWVPETYAGAPIPVAAYLSVVSKAAGVAGLVVVVSEGFASYARIWSPALAVLAAATMTVGNLIALRQSDSVRLLAWSSIAQAGFVLVPLGAMATGSDGVLGASVAYLVIYAVVNLGAFSVVALVGGGRLEGFRGLFWRRRGLALALAFFLLALAGLPPGVAGLFGKVAVVQAAVRGDAVWLAVIAAINVAIGLAYYLRWTALLFQQPEASAPETAEAGLRGKRSAVVAVGIAVVLGIVLSVVPSLALDLLDLVGKR